MLKLCRVTKVKVFFLVLVHVCNFNLFEFSAAILEKGLFFCLLNCGKTLVEMTAREAIDIACERRRISGCRFTPLGGVKRQPEIRLRSQATIDRAEAKNIYNSISPNLKFLWVFFCKYIF